RAISGEMAARPLRTRDRVTLDTPNWSAAWVTVSPRAGKTSSRRVRPGWGGLCIRVMGDSSVVVLVVNQHGIHPLEGKGHAPVAADRYREMPLEVPPLQRVELPAGQVHVLGGGGLIQAVQHSRKPGSMGGLYALGAPCLEE